MPKKKPTADSSNINQIDAYMYPEYDRANIPPVGMAQYDMVASPEAEYEYDPHIDPSLQWAGKAEGTSFTVPTSSIHIHEVINPPKIIHSIQTLGADYQEDQKWLFESDADIAKKLSNKFEFYQHKDKWTNRLIAGDSLVIMNSMLDKEGMAGQVQTVYIDPPYGIKYGSNFQPFVNKRDVKDKKDEDLNTEPEMIKAFRDTWELGIHSYLTYLRDRLLLAKELLSDTGSVFVQISDENVHHVREICDEVFGAENFVTNIVFKKTGSMSGNYLSGIFDTILWYGKNIKSTKYHQLFIERTQESINSGFPFIEMTDGICRRLTASELLKQSAIPEGKRFQSSPVMSSGVSSTGAIPLEYKEKKYFPSPDRHWSISVDELKKVGEMGRLFPIGNTMTFKKYLHEAPYTPINNLWADTMESTFAVERYYVVQTASKVIQRCLLMTTDPGDLVLDITCGSGTTAYVAEQWGRRWITCDTSRIAITLAKKRLMTATFDYYKLAYPNKGVSSGFIYRTVPHVTLKSIANNEPPEQETLYDQPEIEKKIIRISGPFTVEALPAPVVKPLESNDEIPVPFFHENTAKKRYDWMQELRATGISGRGGEKILFSRVEILEGSEFLHGTAETKDNRHAVICFAGETRPLDVRMANQALKEIETIRPKPSYIIFAAFQFDPTAAKFIDDTKWPDVTLLKAQMNADLMTADLKKKSSSSQSFWLIGQPDVELIKIDKDKYKVKVKGFDYYNVNNGSVESGGKDRIAMWMLDTDYDGMSIEPRQVFFPMEGKNEGWDKLAKTLKAEINQDLIEKYRGTESLPFMVKDNTNIAVKIIDDRGIECLKIISIGGANG